VSFFPSVWSRFQLSETGYASMRTGEKTRRERSENTSSQISAIGRNTSRIAVRFHVYYVTSELEIQETPRKNQHLERSTRKELW
jgi:hypothetical protein